MAVGDRSANPRWSGARRAAAAFRQGLLESAKRIPLDLGQGAVAETTEGKQIASRLVAPGQGREALDLGCRAGHQTRWLEDRGYQVTSADIEARFQGATVVDANQSLPFADQRFDLVWCSEVIEHLRDPVASLREMRRVTKLGGELILTTPNSYMWLFRVLAGIGLTPQRLQRRDHLHFFDLRSVRALAPDAELYGYFPWALYKRTLKQDPWVGALSPTFVLRIHRAA